MKRKILLPIFIGICALSSAQVTDSKLYTGATLKYNINKKIRIEFEQQIRFNENISKYDFTFSEFGVRYEMLKYLDLKAIYRYSFIPEQQTGNEISEYNKSKYTLEASTGTKIFNTGLKASYRLRYQNSSESSSTETSSYIRNRIELGYNLSKLVDPYASYESYFRLNGKNEFREDRYILGLAWKITNKLDFESQFIYQYEINVRNPETDYIIELGLVYSFN